MKERVGSQRRGNLRHLLYRSCFGKRAHYCRVGHFELVQFSCHTQNRWLLAIIRREPFQVGCSVSDTCKRAGPSACVHRETHYRLPYLFTYIPTGPIYQVIDRYLTANPAATDLAIVLHKLLRLNAEHLWSWVIMPTQILMTSGHRACKI